MLWVGGELTFISQCSLNSDCLAAVLRLLTLCFCRMIIFYIHVVRILRLCRNAAAIRRENMADLRPRSHNNNRARAYVLSIEMREQK